MRQLSVWVVSSSDYSAEGLLNPIIRVYADEEAARKKVAENKKSFQVVTCIEYQVLSN